MFTRLLVFLSLLLIANTAVAQHPLEPPDTSSPRATLTAFLESVHTAYRINMAAREAYLDSGRLLAPEALLRQAEPSERLIDRAVRCLDLSKVPPRLQADRGIESALLVKEVLDRIELPPMEAVPGTAEIEALDLKRDEPFRWRIPHTELGIARVTEGPRTGEFLFSPETVKRIAADYERVRGLAYRPGASEGFYTLYIRTPGKIVPPRWLTWIGHLPAWAVTLYAEQTLWQWLGLGLTVLIAVAVVMVVHRWSRRFQPIAPVPRLLRSLLSPVVAVVVAALAGDFIDEQLNITGGLLAVLRVIEASVIYLMGAWALLIAGNGVAAWIISSPKIASKDLDASLIRLLFRILAAVAALLLIGYGARELGVALAAVIAGAGVGGLAIALAARSTLENFMGTFNLYADRPVRVGDFCRYGEDPSPGWLRIGTVEEIGLRSTRIRGIDRTITTIPNAEFSNMHIINLTKRDRMLFRTNIGLRYETTSDQLRLVLAELRELLLAHPRMTKDPARVRAMGFGPYSFNLEIFAYVNTADWNDFLAVQEDLVLRIMDIVKQAGTGFAIPSQTLYHTRDAGLDSERQRAAEEAVRKWIAAQTLPFPDFPDDYRKQIVDTLDYPPEGSPDADRG